MIIIKRRMFADLQQQQQNNKNGDNTKENSEKLSKQTQAVNNAQRQAQKANEVTNRNIMLQRMRMQRQLVMNQQQRKRMDQQEKLANMRQLSQARRLEAEKSMKENSDMIRVKKASQEGKKVPQDHTSLYKSSAKLPHTVSMPV